MEEEIRKKWMTEKRKQHVVEAERGNYIWSGELSEKEHGTKSGEDTTVFTLLEDNKCVYFNVYAYVIVEICQLLCRFSRFFLVLE